MKKAAVAAVETWQSVWREQEKDRASEIRVKSSRNGKDTSAEASVACPFCGETSEIAVDPWVTRSETFIEDCDVCCHPRVVHVERDESGVMNIWCERS